MPRGTSSSCRAPGTRTRRATSPASPPPGSGPCPASRTASRWWPRERPRRPSRSTGPRPGTTPPATPSCAGPGATLLDEQGREVAYDVDGRSRCVCAFGGREAVARVFLSRPWHTLGMNARDREGEDFPVRLTKGRAEGDAGRLGRAQGCLLGQLAGDNLGALVEFADEAEIRGSHPDGPRRLVDGGSLEHPRRPADRRLGDGARPGPVHPGAGPVRARGGPRGVPRRGCARRPSTWGGRSARPCATTRTPAARPTAR